MSVVVENPLPHSQTKRSSSQASTIHRRINQILLTLEVLVMFLIILTHLLCTIQIDGLPIFSASATTDTHAHVAPLVTQSALRELSWLDTVAIPQLSEDDNRILSEIKNLAAMNLKFFAIPETVYAQNEIDRLYKYVENQLKLAIDVITEQQAEVILKLIESGMAQGSMMKKEMGSEGSLKNSMAVAVLKEHEGNVHFATAAVSLEPRLGWRFISKQQRNAWNEVLVRVLDARLKQEMQSLSKS